MCPGHTIRLLSTVQIDSEHSLKTVILTSNRVVEVESENKDKLTQIFHRILVIQGEGTEGGNAVEAEVEAKITMMTAKNCWRNTQKDNVQNKFVRSSELLGAVGLLVKML